MSDFITAETYEPSTAFRTMRAHLAAADRNEAQGRDDVAADHRLSADLLTDHTPRVESHEDRYRRWQIAGGDCTPFKEST
jgi:hypothetical protein